MRVLLIIVAVCLARVQDARSVSEIGGACKRQVTVFSRRQDRLPAEARWLLQIKSGAEIAEQSTNSILLEVGPAGYSSWQVSDDLGSAALNPSVHDHVHAVGIQVAVVSVKRNVLLSFHYVNEFSSVDRFQGQCLGLNLILQLSGGSTK